MKKKKFESQANEFIQMAEEYGVRDNYLFVTTFEMYQNQIDMLEKLAQSIKDEGMLVEKEYVKGRKNLYTNPAVSDYNRTADSAHKTSATLLKIIKNLGVAESQDDGDPLMEIISGEEK